MRLCVSCGNELKGTGWACKQCGWAAAEKQGIRLLVGAQGATPVNFSPDEFESLYRLEQTYFWFQARIRLILWALERYGKGCSSFLEIGCGTGAVLSAIAQAHPQLRTWGSEPHLEGLRLAGTRVDPGSLLQMDARRIPFADEFDSIGMFDVLEHIEEEQLVLSQVARALKPEGLLMITVPQHSFLWSPADEHAGHVRRYGRMELVRKVEQAKFTVLKCTSYVSVLFPLLVTSRFLRRKREYDANAEYRMSSGLNRLLALVLSVERAAIRLGATFPFGGSLLLVARRHGG